jgi:beta-glucanase (GH16 family)
MKIVFQAPQKEISWRLDGHEVLRITKPGQLIDRQYMVEDLGGRQTLAFPSQVWYGMGTMTKIQQYPGCKRSDRCLDCNFPSVRQALADPGNEYALEMYNPLLGPPNPAIFWANSGSTAESDFIWGQGSILKIRKLAVYQDLCANPRCDC